MNQCAQHNVSPNNTHIIAAKRIFRYLQTGINNKSGLLPIVARAQEIQRKILINEASISVGGENENDADDDDEATMKNMTLGLLLMTNRTKKRLMKQLCQ